MTTSKYFTLIHKCKLFAEVAEYDFDYYEGHFSFWNSPNFKSFEFSVDPVTFNADPELVLLNAFQRRLKNDG